MTIKETKDYLNRIRDAEREIKKLREKRDTLRSSLLTSGIRYDLDRVQTTPMNKTTDIMIEVLSIEREILQIADFIEHDTAKLARAAGLMNEPERTVIRMWVFETMSLYQIANTLQIDYNRARKAYRNAVRILADV